MRAVFTFGRFNPPTVGHEKLIKKVSEVAKGNDFFIYASFTQNSVKDPLPHKDKVKWMKKVFPTYRSRIVSNSKAKDALGVLVELYGKNYTDVVMVVGSDRVPDFQNLLNKYNGKQEKHGYYEFNTIKVVSAGERDPDSTGVEGMSASKMRKAVVDGDIDLFKSGIPSAVKDSIKANLFNAVKKYMTERALTDSEKKTNKNIILGFSEFLDDINISTKKG
jgi:nicotinic acid mononucleotide adenylyltransferase